jgi:hypothetical protein
LIYIYIYIITILDSLLHYLWQQNTSVFPTYQNLIECLQITLRTKKKITNNVLHVLKYITWTLNVNISVITITQYKNSFHKHNFCFRYKFQNSLVKILRKPHRCKPINIILFQKKYYILADDCSVFPLLINLSPKSRLSFNNINVSNDHILNIIKDINTTVFPFTINVYTSYSFIKQTSKQIQNNLIGQYINCSNNDILHILVTPDLANDSIMINQINLPSNTIRFNKHNLFANTGLTEGDQIFAERTEKHKTLNQHSCVCDHDETCQFIPTRKSPRLGAPLMIQCIY